MLSSQISPRVSVAGAEPMDIELNADGDGVSTGQGAGRSDHSDVSARQCMTDLKKDT